MIILPNAQKRRLLLPMGSLVNGCVFDLDATQSNSYAGTGQTFLNYESNPADGESKAEYNFYLGNAATTDGDEPTFNGSANASSAYFSFDGGDFFKGVNTLSTFLDSIHKTTGGSDFTFVMSLYYVSANQILLTNRLAGVANIGVAMYVFSATDTLRFVQRGDTAASTEVQSVGTINASAWNVIACAHSHSTNTTTLWLNSATGAQTSNTFNATTTTASATNFTIGAYGNDTFPLGNGSRVKNIAAFNKVLTNAEMATVITQMGRRHNINYI